METPKGAAGRGVPSLLCDWLAGYQAKDKEAEGRWGDLSGRD